MIAPLSLKKNILQNQWVPLAILSVLCAIICSCSSQRVVSKTSLVNVDSGWASNSVNTVIFRKNSLCSVGDTQFIAYYNAEQYVVLGKRKIGSQTWTLQTTIYQGNTADAHNCISIMADGKGYLHLAWDHHNNRLHYARSIAPYSLQMGAEIPMTGRHENKVSYPEFYKLANGNLLFFYRDGGSGQGNLVLNRYNTSTQKWMQLQSNLIDGEGKRNAYWQACTDAQGGIHISWVWRESPDVASNHDMCYAYSKDGGISWQKSTGESYSMPINAATAEYALKIPQSSELINQTSMVADAAGAPYIATYWREQGDSIPQYHIIYKKASGWRVSNLGLRKTAFSLSGAGTKRIPISRPQLVSWQQGSALAAALIFRDEEQGNKVSIAVNKDLTSNRWKVQNITAASVGQWEPTYDTELWKQQQQLHLFLQKVEQADAEGAAVFPPQMVQVLEVTIKK